VMDPSGKRLAKATRMEDGPITETRRTVLLPSGLCLSFPDTNWSYRRTDWWVASNRQFGSVAPQPVPLGSLSELSPERIYSERGQSFQSKSRSKLREAGDPED
jgi:hypothetical protein